MYRYNEHEFVNESFLKSIFYSKNNFPFYLNINATIYLV